jgi:hypothetical protein
LYLRVGFGAGEPRVEFDEDDLGHRQFRRARQLARHQLGDERLRPLTRPAKLEHVQAVVVRLDDGRERAALAQRRDVPRGRDRP